MTSTGRSVHHVADLVVPARFCGPPRTGNGGWTAGALAALAERAGAVEPGAAVTVTLRMPPPLDTPLPVLLDEGAATATHEGAPVATAVPATAEPRPVPGVRVPDAAATAAAYPGLRAHPFATCFVCGTARDAGDGLRIFPGPVDPWEVDEPRVAAAWTPHPSVGGDAGDGRTSPAVTTAVTWAALDCTGGWAGDLEERLMVLGRMTAVVRRLPRVGEEHVVVGAARGREGRKTHTAATLLDASGTALAWAEHTWIAVDPAAFR